MRESGAAMRSASWRGALAFVLLGCLPCVAGEAPAPDCSVFHGVRVLTVGGHESNTPVIPVAVDEILIDLNAQRSCHRLRWSIYTVKGVSREQVCFDIGAAAKDETVDVSASFPTGVTATVARLSALDDRATAKRLAEACRMGEAPRNGRTPQGGVDL